MRAYLLFLATNILTAQSLSAQMFSPSASMLPDGELNQPYVGQTIDFTVPQNATISGEVVQQAIGIAFPATQPVLGFLNIENQEFDMIVSRTTILVDGLPSGLSADCDANPCTYIVDANGFITISGTPTESGQFTMDIKTLSEGDVDISSITGGVLAPFGLPQSLDLPVPVPSSLDEEGYTLTVNNTSGIEEQNDVFSLVTYPNPTIDNCRLSIRSRKSGLATVQVLSSTGQEVISYSEPVSFGVNQLKIEMKPLPTGLYFVKVELNNRLALTRIQKL